MRVPVRRLPQTRVSEQQQAYARPVEPLDVTPITRLMEGFRDQLLDEQDARQRIELNRRLLQEVNELQLDFETQKRNPERSPVDFARTLNTEYEARHTALRDELRGEGYSQDLLDDFEGRLGTVRQGFFERGVGHQMLQLGSRADEQIEDVGRHTSQYAATDPRRNYGTARDMLLESVRTHPDLTEEQRAAIEDREMARLRDGAGRALALQDPQYVVERLDPQGLTAPYSAATPASGAATINTENLNEDQAAVATTLSAGGLSPQVVAGFLGNFDVEGGYGGAQGDAGSASGIAQLRGPRRENFIRMYGKEPHEASATEQAQFTLWELNNPAAAGMTQQQVDAIRNARTAEEAAELIDEYYERSSGEHRARRIEAAAGYASAAPARVETAQLQTVDVPAGTGAQQSDFGEVPVPAAAGDISSIVTGDPLLDDLDGRERIQVLGFARERLNQQMASQRAEMDVRIGNITAEAMQNGGEIATPIPTEQEVLQTYGPVEGPQRWAQIQQSQVTGRAVQSFRTQSAEDIQRSLEALEPDPGSPTYATELQIYQGAERAAQALLTQREQDPAGYAAQYFPAVREAAQSGNTAQYYAALDRAYQQLGINPATAPVMTGRQAQQLTDQYRTMTPDQKLHFMLDNMSEMGEQRFRRFIHDMEGTTAESDARIFGLLRTYPGPPGHIPNLFRQILEGREIIAQDPARRPRGEQMTAIARNLLDNAIGELNGEASRAIQESAEGLYAQRHGDPVVIDQRLYRQVLTEVLGGNLPADMRHGRVTDYTILPPRSNEQQFQAWIERQTIQSLTASSVERLAPRYGNLRSAPTASEIINEGTFVMVAPGYYIIKMAGDGRPLVQSNGRRFIVRIDPLQVRGPSNARPAAPAPLRRAM